MTRNLLLLATLLSASGCGGLFDNVVPSQGGDFTASISGAAGANNERNDFKATTVAGSWAVMGSGGILTSTVMSTSTTSTNTQSITISLGSPTALAAGQTFAVGASQSGSVAYAVVTYAETSGSDNSKTKGWKSGTSGTAKINSITGKTLSLSLTDVAMVVGDSGLPATGTFNLSGSGQITTVSGL